MVVMSNEVTTKARELTFFAGKILFARALLFLDQGMVEEAMKSFQAITPSSLLVDFCVANPKLLAATSDSGVFLLNYRSFVSS